MRTLQKITWTLFLIIGLISLYNCSTADYVITTHFKYINQSNEDVELNLYYVSNENFKNYMIPKGGQVEVRIQHDGGKTGVATPFAYDSGYAETVIIKFLESNKCLTNFPKIKISTKYDNFKPEMLNKNNNELIYYIDMEELNEAIPCD